MVFKYSFLLIALFSINAFSQNMVQELRNKIINEKNDSKRAILTSELAQINRFYDPQKSVKQVMEAISLVKKKGTTEEIAQVYLNSIKVFKKADSLHLMIKYADDALLLSNQSTNNLLKGNANQLKGFAELNLNNEQKAYNYFYKSLSFFEKANANAELAKTYYYLFGIFAEKGDLDKERIFALKSLELSQKCNNADLLCTSYQAMGTLYYDMYLNSKKSNHFKKAIHYFEKAEQIFTKRRNEIVTLNQYAIICLNIADIYLKDYQPQYKESIIKYSNLALQNAKEIKDFSVISNVYLIQSEMARKDGDTTLQEKLLHTAENEWKSMQFKDTYLLTSLYETLSHFYETHNNTSLALYYYKKFMDSYQNLNSTKEKSDLRLLEAKFESKKKEEQLRLLTQKNKLQQNLNYLSIAIALLLLVGLAFVNSTFRYKLKFEKQKLILLETQKEEAELVAKLKEEEKARIEAENKLIDAQKIQLQKKLITNALQIEHKNELLKDLGEKFDDIKYEGNTQFKLQNILRTEMKLDSDIEKLRKELQDINPIFINILNEYSQNKLTALDIKYCSAIHAQLDTKQIAALFNVEPESVRMSKYRIKQKLALRKDQDLADFLKFIQVEV